MLNVLIIDDHPLVRGALAQLVERLGEDIQCAEAETLESAMRLIAAKNDFDMIIVDLGLPGVSGLSAVVSIRDQATTTSVVIYTAVDDPQVISQAAQLGVSGYVLKSTSREAMVETFAGIIAGSTYFPAYCDDPPDGAQQSCAGGETATQFAELLTPRQLTVLRLLGEGKSNKQIAYELSLSQETVKIHISAILRKLRVTNRTQATLLAHRLHLPGRSHVSPGA